MPLIKFYLSVCKLLKIGVHPSNKHWKSSDPALGVPDFPKLKSYHFNGEGMFDWIAGKKDTGQLHLSDEAHGRLQRIIQSLNHKQGVGEAALSAKAVLEQLLCGDLSLVSSTARGQIAITSDDIEYRPIEASAEQAVSSSAASEDSEHAESSQSPAFLREDQAAAPQESVQADNNIQQLSVLQNQIEMLKTRLDQRRDQQAAQQGKISSLLRKIRQQEQEIESLKAQVAQLRQTAAIGEAQLNRWRFNNFSR